MMTMTTHMRIVAARAATDSKAAIRPLTRADRAPLIARITTRPNSDEPDGLTEGRVDPGQQRDHEEQTCQGQRQVAFDRARGRVTTASAGYGVIRQRLCHRVIPGVRRCTARRPR